MKNARGNIVILMIGLLAVAAAVSIEIYRRAEVSKQRADQVQFKQEAESLISAFASQISRQDSCTKMLGGFVFKPLSSNKAVLNFTYDPEFPGPLVENSEAAPGVILEQVSLDPDNVDAVSGSPMDPASGADMRTRINEYLNEELTRYPVRLHLSLADKNGRASNVSRNTTLTGNTDLGLPFYLWTNKNGEVVTCFGRNSLAAFCNSVGGFFLPRTVTGFAEHETCKQSIHTQMWINTAWSSKGSCRYGGLTQKSNECAQRYGSEFVALQLQEPLPGTQMREWYLCMSCM